MHNLSPQHHHLAYLHFDPHSHLEALLDKSCTLLACSRMVRTCQRQLPLTRLSHQVQLPAL
uniref:Uncharacterized protein n=1 Tax=Solanum lycopersicum TaxID=4081 RepID=A0A3Q7FCK1_SOLLC